VITWDPFGKFFRAPAMTCVIAVALPFLLLLLFVIAYHLLSQHPGLRDRDQPGSVCLLC
jgi:hypothetical protein